jgi:hypothetical protein
MVFSTKKGGWESKVSQTKQKQGRAEAPENQPEGG